MIDNYRNILLGTVSGLAGIIAKNVVHSFGRSIPRKPRSLQYFQPQPLYTSGIKFLVKYGFGILGGIGITHLLLRTNENAVEKGVVSGFVGGSITDNLTSKLSNDIQPKSTLLTVLSNVVYGFVTTILAFRLNPSPADEHDTLETYLKQVRKEVKGEHPRNCKPTVRYRRNKIS